MLDNPNKKRNKICYNIFIIEMYNFFFIYAPGVYPLSKLLYKKYPERMKKKSTNIKPEVNTLNGECQIHITNINIKRSISILLIILLL